MQWFKIKGLICQSS